jgi:hypothetical protein
MKRLTDSGRVAVADSVEPGLDAVTEILAERVSSDGRVRWQARRSADRGRLIVVGVVQPSDVPTIVTPLTDEQLRDLLGDVPSEQPDRWICAQCGASNAADRKWCLTCSEAS